MQDEIGIVICKGLAQCCKEKPKNPIDFFAKWLLVQHHVTQREKQEALHEKWIDKMKAKKADKDEIAKNLSNKEKADEKAIIDEQTNFCLRTENCQDPSDMLQELVDHLQANTKATCVHLGQMRKPIKGLS